MYGIISIYKLSPGPCQILCGSQEKRSETMLSKNDIITLEIVDLTAEAWLALSL